MQDFFFFNLISSMFRMNRYHWSVNWHKAVATWEWPKTSYFDFEDWKVNEAQHTYLNVFTLFQSNCHNCFCGTMSNTLICNFWGAFAIQLKAYMDMSQNENGSMVILYSWQRLKKLMVCYHEFTIIYFIFNCSLSFFFTNICLILVHINL